MTGKDKKRPTTAQLWDQAKGVQVRFDELLIEHGYVQPAPDFPEDSPLTVEEIRVLAANAHPYAERLYSGLGASVVEKKIAALIKGLALGVDQLLAAQAAPLSAERLAALEAEALATRDRIEASSHKNRNAATGVAGLLAGACRDYSRAVLPLLAQLDAPTPTEDLK
ncbi:hypothetical protein [Deinococcus sp. Leaf326]|uniref:hypothetical protein n=1 Tax=Deinococcus sp. Leaf326 TaxID=1736338 RepID=UPI0006F25072|nr:hypothetical protein [Deinococcus sp. Leaf326]KQR40780.1 hypothetical protein ASF71_01015 [Deinococcus sp. Leaf326]